MIAWAPKLLGQAPGDFQFTLNSGFADQTGDWLLTGGSDARTGTPTGGDSSSTSGTAQAGATGIPTGAGTTQCDPNISAGPNTSCPFSEDVFKHVARDYQRTGAIPVMVSASSTATDQTYSMQCALNDSIVTCSGGNNASVTFPLRAVQVY